MGGCDDAACNEQLGKVLDAPFVVSGSIGKVEKNFVVTLSLIDTKDQKAIARVSEEAVSADKTAGRGAQSRGRPV